MKRTNLKRNHLKKDKSDQEPSEKVDMERYILKKCSSGNKKNKYKMTTMKRSKKKNTTRKGEYETTQLWKGTF